MDQLVQGLLWYFVFLFSTTLHEAAHAFAAFKLGDRTAYEGGHLTVDPVPHMRHEPFGMVVVPIASFLLGGWMIGWASVPYNPRWAAEYPQASAKMSIAGPLANLLLVLAAALFIRLGMLAGVFCPLETIDQTQVICATQGGVLAACAAFLNIALSLNLLLFLFNLLPLPPLDGSGIIPYLLSREHAQKYLELISNSSFSLIGLFIAWKLFDIIYAPLHLAFINLLFYPEAHYG
jgi:Zn-dependent protease